jgi:hypothetical protein
MVKYFLNGELNRLKIIVLSKMSLCRGEGGGGAGVKVEALYLYNWIYYLQLDLNSPMKNPKEIYLRKYCVR